MARKSRAMTNDTKQTHASWCSSLAFWGTLGFLAESKAKKPFQHHQRDGLACRMALAFYKVGCYRLSLPSPRAFSLAIAIVFGLALSSCFPNVTTTKISHLPDGTIRIDSGKDVKIGNLHFKEGSAELDVANYSSNASAAVVEAQGKREVDQLTAINAILQNAIAAAVSATAKGVKP